MVDCYSNVNFVNGLWFRQIGRQLCYTIKKEWIKYLKRLSVYIPFLIKFPTFTLKKQIQDVHSVPSINVQMNLPNS